MSFAPAQARAVARQLAVLSCAMIAAACGDQSTGPGATSGTAVSAVIITPPSAVVGLGASRTLTAVTADSTGATLTGRTVSWSSSAPTIVSVSSSGSVSGVAMGSATITATSENKTGTTTIFVLTPVATITVSATRTALIAHSEQQISAVMRDAAANELSGRLITWSSSNATVATVDANGRVTARAPGTATITATSETRSGSVALTVAADPITEGSLAAGSWHTCALTSDGRAYCWGVGTYLGVSPAPLTRSPVEVAGGRIWSALAAGVTHTIGLTSSGEVYAWGQNTFGELGDGSSLTRLVPVRVSIPGTVRAIAASGSHSIALTTTGAVYTWGYNIGAQVGDPATQIRRVPYAVTGLPSNIAKIAATNYASFAITAAGVAYGWGESGQVGGVNPARTYTPVLVAGNRIFSMIASGGQNGSTVGLTTAGLAYSWGNSSEGSLGHGSTTSGSVTVPTAVAGGLVYSSVASGNTYSVALTPSGDAYTWGWNSAGNIGDGTMTSRGSPTLVSGGRKFVAVDAGDQHALGFTAEGELFGWGRADGNQTGDGTLSGPTLVPTEQAKPGFSMVATAGINSIVQGGSKSASFTISRTDGGFSRAGILQFKGTVTFSVVNAPPGITATIAPTTWTAGAATTVSVTISVSSAAALGPALIEIRGTSPGAIDRSAFYNVSVTAPPPPGAASNYRCIDESTVVAPGYQCVTYGGKTTLVKHDVPELWGAWVDRTAGVCFNWKEGGQATVQYQGGGLLGGAARTTPAGRWGALATSTGGFYPNPTQWYVFTAQADDQTKALGYDSGTKQIVGWSFTKEGGCPW